MEAMAVEPGSVTQLRQPNLSGTVSEIQLQAQRVKEALDEVAEAKAHLNASKDKLMAMMDAAKVATATVGEVTMTPRDRGRELKITGYKRPEQG